MKFNWGTGIVISFVLFALTIGYIIAFPFNQKVELVTEDYYEKELKYQEQIDRQDRSSGLNEQINIERDGKLLHLNFPVSFREIKGEVFFYRPSDSQKDFTEGIKTDSSNHQAFDVSRLDPGLWKIKVLWNMKDQSYYFEKIVIM